MPIAATLGMIAAGVLIGVGVGRYTGYRAGREAADHRLAEAALHVAGSISDYGQRYMRAFVTSVPLNPTPILHEIARLAIKDLRSAPG